MLVRQQRRSIRKRRRATFPKPYRKRFRAAVNLAPYAGRITELKFHDVVTNNLAADSNGLITASLLTIPEGVGESERIGRKVVIRKIQLYAAARLLSVTDLTNASVDCRFIVYLDTQTNGAAAVALDILELATIRSFRNLSNVGRFKILMDKRMGISASAGGAHALDSTHSFTVTKVFGMSKACSIPIEYDNSATTGAIATMRSNNIGLLVLADINTRVQFDTNFRFRYSD